MAVARLDDDRNWDRFQYYTLPVQGRGPDPVKLSVDTVRETIQSVTDHWKFMARDFQRYTEARALLKAEHQIGMDADWPAPIRAAFTEWLRSPEAPVELRDPMDSIPEFLRT